MMWHESRCARCGRYPGPAGINAYYFFDKVARRSTHVRCPVGLRISTS